MGFGTFVPGLSCPFTGDEAFASETGWTADAFLEAVAFFLPILAKRF
jgi:hypothetical protein